MKNKSIYAIQLGTLGFIFFAVAQYRADYLSNAAPEQTNVIYILCGLGVLLFIVSFVFGLQGFRNPKVSKVLQYAGVLFSPILILFTLGYFFLIGWLAFI